MIFDAIPPAALTLLTGGVLFALIALLSPKAALFVLLPTIALAPEMPVGRLGLRPDDLMVGVLAIAVGMRRLTGGREGTPLDRPLVAYLAVGLVTTLWGAAWGTADLWSLDQTTGSGLHVLKRLLFVLYFFILTDTIRSVADARRLVYTFIISLAAMGVYSVGRFLDTGIALAPFGAAIHEPGLAALLGVGLALGLLVGAKRPEMSILATLILVGSFLTLPFSLGRNFVLSTTAMFGIVALSRRPVLLLFIPIVWLTVPALFPEHVVARMLSVRWALSPFLPDPTVGASLYIPSRLAPGIAHIWDVFTTSPLFGWGMASVPLGFVDSEYAWQFVSSGLLGAIVFVWLIVRIARTSRETFRKAQAEDSPALPLVAGLRYCLLGYALYSVFSPSISAARAGSFFFTIIGLIAVLHRELVAGKAAEGGAGGSVAT